MNRSQISGPAHNQTAARCDAHAHLISRSGTVRAPAADFCPRLRLVRINKTVSEQLEHVFHKGAQKFVQECVREPARGPGAHLYGGVWPGAGLHLRQHHTGSPGDQGKPPVHPTRVPSFVCRLDEGLYCERVSTQLASFYFVSLWKMSSFRSQSTCVLLSPVVTVLQWRHHALQSFTL